MNVHALIKADFINIRRDPMLMLAALAPALIAALLVFGFPSLRDFLWSKFVVAIDPYYDFACVFLMSVIPMLFGMVYGFILLDERDAGLLTCYAVTPLGKSGYLRLRMLAPVLFSFIVLVIFVRITGFAGGHFRWPFVPLALIMALQAPIMLLFLGAYAANKVEGMAIAKGFGILLMAVPIDYFIHSKWAYIAGLSPLFWTARGFFAQDNTHVFLCLLAALAVHALYLFLLYRKFAASDN